MRRLVNEEVKAFAKKAVSESLPIIKSLCLLHVTGAYVCSPVPVYGRSMLPTVNVSGDILLADHLSPLLGKVHKGDVVLVRSPENPMMGIAKRVRGIAGDVITFTDPYNDSMTFTVKIPKGHVWLEGDNKPQSRDSRHFGAIPHGLILGKVFCRVWPPRDFGFLDQSLG